MKILKWVGIVFLLIFIIIQFLPNKLPTSIESTNESFISNHHVSKDISGILRTSCFDCHSNHVNYPWYSHIAPVSWLVSSDVEKGRKKLNFSEWESYKKAHQIRKLGDIKDQIEGNEMPMSIYTFIHRNAKLDDKQKTLIVKWTDELSDRILNE
jgi:hypothetical protein